MRYEKYLTAVLHNWPAKVLSLAVALMLMVFFNLTRLEQRIINVPLAVSLNDEMAVSTQLPRTVRIVLKGERDTIYGIREDDISAYLELSGIKSEGAYRIPVKLEKRGNALSADPLEIAAEPLEIAVGLEKKAIKTVPVTPSFKGFLEPGYELSSFDIQPPEIVISGPAGLIARTSDVSTDIIELNGKRNDFSIQVRIMKKDPLITLEGKDTIAFSAKIKKSMQAQTIENIKIAVKNLAPGFTVSQPLLPGVARVSAAEGISLPMQDNDILFVDAQGINKPGEYTLPVRAESLPGIVIDTFEPQEVRLAIESLGVAGGASAGGQGNSRQNSQKP